MCWIFVQPQFAGADNRFNTPDSLRLTVCERIVSAMKVARVTGAPIPSRRLNRSLLGTGVMGGIVTLVRNPVTGHAWVEKDFHDPEMFLNDRLALAFTHMAFSERPHTHFKAVELLKVDDFNNRLRLQWVPGEAMDKRTGNWAKPSLSRESAALLELYKAFVAYYVEVMDAFLEETDLKITIQDRTVDELSAAYWLEYEMEEGLAVQVDLMIKPDNIVIRDDPRQLVLIDPY